MVFDITNLDKELLIRSLFVYAEPLGLGKNEYYSRFIYENANILNDKEYERILWEFDNLDYGNSRLLDYYKGKPMKLDLTKKKNGRILASTEGYDIRNGKYRFFEVLLNMFLMEDIFITRKGYSPYIFNNPPENIRRNKEEENTYKNILNNVIQKENEYGKYWVIDQSKIKYNAPYRKGFEDYW